MSILSKLTGINIRLIPSEKTVISDVANVVLHGIEQNSPLAAKIITVAEEVIANPPTSAASAVTDTGHVIAILDPNFEAQFNAKLSAFATTLGAKFNIPAADITLALNEIEPDLDGALEALGIPHVAAA